MWSGNPTRSSDALEKRANNSITTYSTHIMTQVDKLRAKGITGKGARIAVIDSGVSSVISSCHYYPSLTNIIL